MTLKNTFKTEQEAFWAGEFGSKYISRNKGSQLLASNLALFSRALEKAQKIDDCIEFGANIGMNLHALKLLYPEQNQYAVEINPDAASELRKQISPDNVFETSLLDFEPLKAGGWDLALIKGVLIHINPEVLDQVYTNRTYAKTPDSSYPRKRVSNFSSGYWIPACAGMTNCVSPNQVV